MNGPLSDERLKAELRIAKAIEAEALEDMERIEKQRDALATELAEAQKDSKRLEASDPGEALRMPELRWVIYAVAAMWFVRTEPSSLAPVLMFWMWLTLTVVERVLDIREGGS